MANYGISNFNSPGLSQRSPLGGFRHYQGFQPTVSLLGDPQHSSTRIFHVPVGNATSIFKGDIVYLLGTGAGDLYQDELQYGGAGQGNPAQAADVAVLAPGDTTHLLAGVVVGFELTLLNAKTGVKYVPAATEGWLRVECDPNMEYYVTSGGITLPPAGSWQASIGSGIDVLARDATYTSTAFGISGLSIDPTTQATTATLPVKILGAANVLFDDVVTLPTGTVGGATSYNPVILTKLNSTRMLFGTGANIA